MNISRFNTTFFKNDFKKILSKLHPLPINPNYLFHKTRSQFIMHTNMIKNT